MGFIHFRVHRARVAACPAVRGWPRPQRVVMAGVFVLMVGAMFAMLGPVVPVVLVLVSAVARVVVAVLMLPVAGAGVAAIMLAM